MTWGRSGARLAGSDEAGGGGGRGAISQEGLRVPARHPGVVGQGQDGGQSSEAGEVLLASPGEDWVGPREAGDLTSSSQLEILLLQQDLLLGVQARQLLVPVNSLEDKSVSQGSRR